jgi:transcriptional regulator with XRE-family HTH domain
MMANEKLGLGARIGELIAFKRLSQSDFARSVGMSPGYLSSVIREEKIPGSEFLHAIKKAFGVSADWLLTGEGDMFTKGPGGPDQTPGYLDRRLFEEVQSTLKSDESAFKLVGAELLNYYTILVYNQVREIRDEAERSEAIRKHVLLMSLSTTRDRLNQHEQHAPEKFPGGPESFEKLKESFLAEIARLENALETSKQHHSAGKTPAPSEA